MNIGILTLPLHTNYGGILQAYALQFVLKEKGHQVVVINKSRKIILPYWKYPFLLLKRLLSKYILNRDVDIFYEKTHNNTYDIVSQYTQPFIEKNIKYLNINNLSRLNENDFDAIIVGSDQIWRPKYYRYIFNAYLQFAQTWSIKRIAYAASFGTSEWEYTQKETIICKDLIHKFDHVSVREYSGIDLCKIYFNRSVQHVLDPTMLLNQKDYIRLFNEAQTPKSTGTLLCYILDETEFKHKVIDNIAKKKHLKPFKVNSKVENPKAPINERIQPPVETWLRGFYDAEFVITDSFHACVFSIIFNKPFLVIGNEERGIERFKSLLNMFNLDDRLIIDKIPIEINDIDYTAVEKILNIKRQESLLYLETAIQNE